MFRLILTAYLAGVWLLVPSPGGLFLFVIGAGGYWSLQRLNAFRSSTGSRFGANTVHRSKIVKQVAVPSDDLNATLQHVRVVTGQHFTDAPSNILVDTIVPMGQPPHQSPGRDRPRIC